MSIKVFVEYKIKNDKKNVFFPLIPQIKNQLEACQAKSVRLFEGTDQPLLIVEEYEVDRMEIYHEIKEERSAGRKTIWETLNECVAGGSPKVNIWAFHEIDSS
jgi:hypothetical protein